MSTKLRSLVSPVVFSMLLAASPLSAQDAMKAAENRTIRVVAILVHDGVELLGFAGSAEVFARARGKHGERFRIVTVAPTEASVTSLGFLTIEPQYTFETCPKPDIVVLPGGSTRQALQHAGLVPWVRQVAREAEVVLSVGTGAGILAKAGLLDGLEATTHYRFLEALAEAAPDTKVRADRRIVDTGKIVTTAGGSAGIDGALHVVERLLGLESATECARYVDYRWTRDHFRSSGLVVAAEREVSIRHSADGPVFAGLLVLPPGEGPHPAVLLVSPAGEHGRDELRRGGAHFSNLAMRLASGGIASLRIDNRGIGGSRNDSWPEWRWSITMMQLAADLAGHFEWLRQLPEIDLHRVGVLAHGDGTVPAARLAADLVPGARRPAFTILLSASGRRGVEDLTQRFLASANSPDKAAVDEAAKCIVSALTALVEDGPTPAVVDGLAACLPMLGLPEAQAKAQAQGFAQSYGQTWHREYLGYEPREVIRRIQGPLLVLLGDDDDRLDAEASEKIMTDVFRESLAFNARCKRLANRGHFLEPGDGRKILCDEVVDLVRRFITDATGFDPTPVEAAPRSSSSLLISHVTIVDVETGELRKDRWVTIRGGVIAAIGDARPTALAESTKEIDGRGRYLIPGLWDSHVHVSMWGKDALPRFVRHGITTVRDMGGDLRELTAWRDQIDAGDVLGPRMLIAGPFLDGDKPNDIYRRFLEDTDEVELVVDELLAAGVDFLKVHSRLSPSVFRKVAEIATQRGVKYAGHIPAGLLPLEVSDAGITSIEHADSFFSALPRARNASVANWPQAREWWQGDEGRLVLERIAANDTVVVPSLTIIESVATRLGGVAETIAPWTREITRSIHAAGIPIAAGTDTARRLIGVAPGDALHHELELLVACGLSPLEALQAATLVPARRFGGDPMGGVIAVGQPADLVLLHGNPLEEIGKTRSIDSVVVRGKLISITR